MVFAAERRFREMAEALRLPIRGSYDPSDAGCEDADFLDGGHARESCPAKIFSRPAGGEPPR
jgi:hypothetical protein